VTQAVRGPLRRSISDWISQNDDKNYDILRPEGIRLLPVGITHPFRSEAFNAFGVTISECYDVQLDEDALPSITSNTQLPRNHRFPESSELGFRRELIKVRYSSCRKLHSTNLHSSMPFTTAQSPRTLQPFSCHQSFGVI
jgi:hypothetical protein